MIRQGDVLDLSALNARVEIRRTSEDTGGELFEFDVVGRPRGVITYAHVHPLQSERHEVIEGTLRLTVDGVEHMLHPGEAMDVPAGTPHRQVPGPELHGRVRVQHRPAGRTGAFLERLAAMSQRGGLNRLGLPTPRAGARLFLDFADEAHLTRPSAAVQGRLARAILRVGSH